MRRPKAKTPAPAPPIDLVAVRQATAELRRIARQHPEAFAPDRLPATAAEVAKMLGEKRKGGRPAKADAAQTVTIRLRPATLRALVELARGRGTPPRALARAAIERLVAETE